MIELTPTQDSSYRVLRYGLDERKLLTLYGATGRGKTTVLKKLHGETGGGFVTSKDFLENSGTRHPLSLEESLYSAVLDALRQNDIVHVDDVDLIYNATAHAHFHPRGRYIETVFLELAEIALREGKRLVLSTTGALGEAYAERSFPASLRKFGMEDYAALFQIFDGEAKAVELDAEKIYRFAPKLNARQLKGAWDWLRCAGPFNTEEYIEYLRGQKLASNVDLGEVQQVSLDHLEGVDSVIRNLEIHIVLPLSNDALSSELGLKPKRGVLLYGPPGTGKTTVGRALAHRLRGKFFLIDGTFIAGTGDFYARVQHIFEAAKDNSPSVIFIDDADAIFEDGEERGLYRYLLTMLDGLESEGTARVCVMMTAMNLSHLPPALVRSGRVELWLEMKLPDGAARAKILARLARELPPELASVNADRVIEATEEFTGADMKRLVEDAKGLYAFDRAGGVAIPEPEIYFVEAADAVRDNKQRFQQAESAARARPRRAPGLPLPHFAPPGDGDDD